ncbi:GtrA family protein [Roseibium sp. TrichSKD4]|uniref:GtrA family protein n=1 Tax=Roseibium sp. TrichSKD4 TaxID=744980 RepID=UPI001112C6C1|nr:GtrA family protein [Roseibium sp. TrichSKD4]
MRRIVIFGMISLVGALIDFPIVSGMLALGQGSLLAFAVAMCVSGSVVYVFHQKLTFSDQSGPQFSRKRLAQFLGNTLVVFLFRVAVFEAVSLTGLQQEICVALAIVSSFFLNYLVSRFWIFKANVGEGKE